MYEQIKEQIREAIFCGKLKNNELLPSVRALSALLNVSAITVKRAYSDLENEGFTYTSSGKGTFVKAPDKEAMLEEFRQKKLKEFEEYARSLLCEGYSKNELTDVIEKI